MNQILVSEKIYVTQEMKKKKKIYKIIFILCLILVIILTGYYVFAEYDKNQKEQISKEILGQMNDDTTVEEQMIVVALDDNVEEESPVINIPTTTSNTIESEVTANGKTYTTDSRRWDANSERFSPVQHEEFEYNGKRYVRVKSNDTDENFKLSNGVTVHPGMYV